MSGLSAALEGVGSEQHQPNDDSQKDQSEWDDIVVDETFARLVYNFLVNQFFEVAVSFATLMASFLMRTI